MSYRGVTFNKQTCKSEDDALIFHTFLNGCSGKIKGCAVTYDAQNVYMSTGYFMAYGRLVNIFGAETLTPVAIPTGTQYNRLVFTIDLSKENTAAEFKQGFFQFLSSYDAYPTLTRQDLFNGGTVYQIPIAKFTLTVSGIGNFVEEMGSVSISDVWNTLTQDLAEYRGQFETFFDTEKTTILQMIADLQAQDFVTNAVFNSQMSTVNTNITTASTKAQAALLDLTDQYSVTKTYALGEFCIYNNVLYKCTTAITVAEAWNATHWTQTNVIKEMAASGNDSVIINGGFDIWQRGTSQSTSGYGSDDRWSNIHYCLTKNHSRQAFAIGQIAVPNNPVYFARTQVNANTDAAQNYCINEQHIEDVTKLSGKTYTVSFWAKADAVKNLGLSIDQMFGTGGSAGVVVGSTKFSLTTSWKRYTFTVTLPSVSGKTIGINNYTNLRFWLSAGTNYGSPGVGSQTGTFDIANVTMVEGPVPKEWNPENQTELIAKCQRYFEKSYNLDVPYGAADARGMRGESLISSAAGLVRIYIPFKVQKRCAPTVTLGTTGVSVEIPSVGIVSVPIATWDGVGENSATGYTQSTGYGGVGGIGTYHWTADAEI